jgi:hypothetical protein
MIRCRKFLILLSIMTLSAFATPGIPAKTQGSSTDQQQNDATTQSQLQQKRLETQIQQHRCDSTFDTCRNEQSSSKAQLNCQNQYQTCQVPN